MVYYGHLQKCLWLRQRSTGGVGDEFRGAFFADGTTELLDQAEQLVILRNRADQNCGFESRGRRNAAALAEA